jgi:hypothetical protein
MATLQIYDRPLCCSTGICGPSVDPVLVAFAADLEWLREQGVNVSRYNLAFEPGEFTKNDDVKQALSVGQVACLPIVRVDAQIVSQGRYPTRDELKSWCVVQAKGAEMPAASNSCCSGTSCCL